MKRYKYAKYANQKQGSKGKVVRFPGDTVGKERVLEPNNLDFQGVKLNGQICSSS